MTSLFEQFPFLVPDPRVQALGRAGLRNLSMAAPRIEKSSRIGSTNSHHAAVAPLPQTRNALRVAAAARRCISVAPTPRTDTRVTRFHVARESLRLGATVVHYGGEVLVHRGAIFCVGRKLVTVVVTRASTPHVYSLSAGCYELFPNGKLCEVTTTTTTKYHNEEEDDDDDDEDEDIEKESRRAIIMQQEIQPSNTHARFSPRSHPPTIEEYTVTRRK